MLILKDGSVSHDARFDRVVKFDDRSREFPVTAGINASLPVSKTWTCPVVLDQGSEGACVGFGIAHALASHPYPVSSPRMTNKFARQQIYWEAQKIDRWPGGNYPGADPVYSGTAVLAGLKVVKEKKLIDKYEWSFSLEELILGVGYRGPAILGVHWHQGMYTPDQNGYIWPTRSAKVGGHCILCIGVNVQQKTFTLHNSWGPYWGNYGTCFITFDEMNYLLNNMGEAAFITKNIPE